MTEEDDLQSISIEIPEEEAVKSAETPKETPKPNDHEAALADLRAQIDAQKEYAARERSAREEAERRARENAEAASRAKSDAQDGQLTAIQNAIRATSAEAEGAEKAYADALQAGDYAQAAKAQRLMASAEAKLLQLENGKSALEERLEAEKTQKPDPIPARQPQVDIVEQWASTVSPQSAAWLRSHGDAIRQDQSLLRKIGAAHDAAIHLEGLAPDSPEYFSFIEGKIGIGTKKAEQPRQETPLAPARKPVVATPVSNASSSSPRGGSTITLSPEMREMARQIYSDLPPHEAEKAYARDRMAMIKEGRIQG